ncbi:hypothetical protein EDC04DRAFT_3023520 [Pisolithus marmoratus]|nr:hypothetical protein EDC04DRAFT_3023520 [Pisolithus marmoratus]
MPDPESRYASLKNSHDLKDVTVQSPDVFDANGMFIHTAEYNTKLHDGQVVEVDIILHLWTFKPGLKDVNGSRIYQVMLQGMKLMPYAEYVKSNLVRRALPQTPNCKGKRKASESPCNQSPLKKTMTLSEVEDVANMQKCPACFFLVKKGHKGYCKNSVIVIVHVSLLMVDVLELANPEIEVFLWVPKRYNICYESEGVGDWRLRRYGYRSAIAMPFIGSSRARGSARCNPPKQQNPSRRSMALVRESHAALPEHLAFEFDFVDT